MLTDRQMFDLFSEALVDEPADPTFLDELFEVVLEETRTSGLAIAPVRPLGAIRGRASSWRAVPRWIGLAAAALVVAVVTLLLFRAPQIGPLPTPSPSPFPALTGRFTSPLGGYSISYPDGASVDAATEVIAPGLHSWNPDQPWVDNILDRSGFGQWTIVSAPIPDGTTAAQWLADELDTSLLSGTGFPACGPTMVTEAIVIGGVDGTIDVHCPTISIDAIVSTGGRAYVFGLATDNPNMTWFRAVLATVQLDPAAAAPYVSPGPTSPGPTPPVIPATDLVPFTSTQYGYALRYPSNWGARSATAPLGTDYPFDFSSAVDYFSATAPAVADPGLIVAAGAVAPGTTLDQWMTSIKTLQGGQFTCPAPTEEAITVGGLPATLLAWDACPVSLLWVGFVQGSVAYDVLWIDEFATGNPTQLAADRSTLDQILATVAVPAAPELTGSSAPAGS
jgi:hypothetical protein